MKRGWQYAGAAFAILFALWAQQAWKLSLTDTLGPGPGFFPFILALLGLLLALLLVFRADAVTRQSEHAFDPVLPARGARFPVGVLLGSLIAVALLLEPLGYRLTVAAFSVVVLPALGARNFVVIGLFAAAASFGVYAVFSDLLKVPLPSGVLGL